MYLWHLISKYFWHKQSGLKSQTPQNLEEVVVVVAQNVEIACSANLEQVFSPLDQSGVSNFALSERKIKKNALCFNQSTLSNFAL